MPDLDLRPLRSGKVTPYLAAVMLFPRDVDRQREFAGKFRNWATGIHLRFNRPSITTDLLADVVAAAAGEKLSPKEKLAYLLGGDRRHLLAGRIFLTALGGVRSLRAVIDKIATDGGRLIPQRGESNRNLFGIWTEFAPSAHLSATALIFPTVWHGTVHSAAHCGLFLEFADDLRLRGERHRMWR